MKTTETLVFDMIWRFSQTAKFCRGILSILFKLQYQIYPYCLSGIHNNIIQFRKKTLFAAFATVLPPPVDIEKSPPLSPVITRFSNQPAHPVFM
jgi:hypothetical protein